MSTILDAESSFLNANARVQKWRAKFIQRWLAPLKETQLLMWWEAQTPEMHATMKALSPQAHAEVEKKIKELKERQARNG